MQVAAQTHRVTAGFEYLDVAGHQLIDIRPQPLSATPFRGSQHGVGEAATQRITDVVVERGRIVGRGQAGDSVFDERVDEPGQVGRRRAVMAALFRSSQ